MLYIHIRGREQNCVSKIDSFFNRRKKPEWFNDPVVRDIIFDIDKTEIVQGEVLKSPVFGIMAPDRLSQGCKAVILLECIPGINIYATKCGDNCCKSILKVAENKDTTITLHHCMRFPDTYFEATILETGTVIHNHSEFCDVFYDRSIKEPDE